MISQIILKLFEIIQEFIKDKSKAREFVSRIEQTIDAKFDSQKDYFVSKKDLYEVEAKISTTIYIVGLIQFLAIVASVHAIVGFMTK
ncbi:hypothetical protein [Flavobacterium ovatum]|uniref:hypothetical protein n=1 Tax=Flavobacterium ovatum TaxID=1928857 RepID=UPI0034502251